MKMTMEETRVLKLTRDVINRQWFHGCIGGLKVSKSEKEMAILRIKNAMNSGEFNRITIGDFAKSYPDSLSIVREFFSKIIVNYPLQEHYLPSEYRHAGFTNESQYKRALAEEKRAILEAKSILLVIYGNILSQYTAEAKVNKILKYLDIDLTTFGRIINLYNVSISNGINAVRDLDINYSDDIAEIIITDFLKSGGTKEEICSKYKIGAALFQTFADKYIERHPESQDTIKKQLIGNSNKRYNYMNNLIIKIADYINQGIIIDSVKLPFTMLDYISLTDMNIDTLIEKIKNLKDFDSKEELYASRAVLKFYEKNRNLGRFVNNTETILQQKNVFIIGNTRFEPTEKDIEEIFSLFDEHRIPKTNSLIHIALYRKAKGVPILPLINNEKEETDIIKPSTK